MIPWKCQVGVLYTCHLVHRGLYRYILHHQIVSQSVTGSSKVDVTLEYFSTQRAEIGTISDSFSCLVCVFFWRLSLDLWAVLSFVFPCLNGGKLSSSGLVRIWGLKKEVWGKWVVDWFLHLFFLLERWQINSTSDCLQLAHHYTGLWLNCGLFARNVAD